MRPRASKATPTTSPRACWARSWPARSIPEGVARAVRLELPKRFGVAVVVPDFVLPTVEARAVLPETYSREDAIFNVQRSALLIAALATGAVDAFPAALEDRLHQPYRLRLVPGLEEVAPVARAGPAGLRAERRGAFRPGLLRAGSRKCLRPRAAGFPPAWARLPNPVDGNRHPRLRVRGRFPTGNVSLRRRGKISVEQAATALLPVSRKAARTQRNTLRSLRLGVLA